MKSLSPLSQMLSGVVTWGVTLDYPALGILFVRETFTRARASGKREENVSNYIYYYTGGTMHGSQGSTSGTDLLPGSRFNLWLQAELIPRSAYGSAQCVVQ